MIAHVVNVYEYERGWGSRLDDTIEFPTKEAAKAYVKNFNASNVEDVVPDWYMIAEYVGIKEVK